MSELNVSFRPELRRPVMVAAFRGWNDGGQGASLGAAYLAKQWGAARFAEIEPETFFDFQAVRPQVSLVDGETRTIEWPDNGFFHAAIPGADRDVVLLLGIEPNLRWRTFSNLVLGLAQDLGVEMLVTLGSLLADVPHTRPAPVTASATDPALVEKLGLDASRYEGPTGIVGIVHDACRGADIDSVSLWAAVPHYVSLAPSPRAALALVRRFGELLHVDVDLSELEQAADEYAEQVSEAVSTDAETAAYVEELEQRVDALASEPDLPSGETLAAELTRFLREREEEEEHGGSGGPEGPAS
jgi:proteasome assembly chaperone (PAC2) family protein